MMCVVLCSMSGMYLSIQFTKHVNVAVSVMLICLAEISHAFVKALAI